MGWVESRETRLEPLLLVAPRTTIRIGYLRSIRKEPMPAAPVVAVLPKNHRLASKRKLKPADFEGESFISLGPSALSRFRIDRMFADHDVNRVMRIETPLSEIADCVVNPVRKTPRITFTAGPVTMRLSASNRTATSVPPVA